jgi:hypothetical protein
MPEDISAKTTVVKADGGNLVVADPVLAEYAAEIHHLRKRAKEDIIEIGRYLDQAQKHAGHGTWLAWIEAEFGWSDQTARRFIHVYELSRDSKFNKLLSSNLPLSALYQLAAPKTPEAAREAITERIEAGGKVSVAAVTEAVTKAKGKTTEPARVKPGAGSGEQSIEERKRLMAALAAEPEASDLATAESTDLITAAAAMPDQAPKAPAAKPVEVTVTTHTDDKPAVVPLATSTSTKTKPAVAPNGFDIEEALAIARRVFEVLSRPVSGPNNDDARNETRRLINLLLTHKTPKPTATAPARAA